MEKEVGERDDAEEEEEEDEDEEDKTGKALTEFLLIKGSNDSKLGS